VRFDDPERLKEIRREFERIEALPAAEREKEIPRVYREMPPDMFFAYFCGEQPKIILQPGGPPRFLGQLYHRSADLLAAHLKVVRPLVQADLQSGDRERLAHALSFIGWLRLHEFYDAVVVAFRQDAVEQVAAGTLRDLDDPRAIRVLLEKHPHDPLRYYAFVGSLSKQRPADPMLVKLLRSEDAKTRWRAACALSGSGDPVLVPEVERLAKDPDPKVRQEAAGMGSVLAKGGFARSRLAVLALLKDEDVGVRVTAACLLAAQKDMACARTLLEMLQDGSLEELQHSQVRDAVHYLAGTHFGYYHGSDGWKPTTENNKAAIQKFAEWVEKSEGKES
jgi:hypothetical protein